MKELTMRVLMIDDDERMLARTASALRGQSITIRGRTAVAEVETLTVNVERHGPGYGFTNDTLRRFLDRAHSTYDAIIIDYSFAESSRQRRQWHEDGQTATASDSNAHLLTFVELEAAVREYDDTHGGEHRHRLKTFFAQRTEVLLRSFQHDRKFDRLGPFETRVNAVKGQFKGAQTIDTIDSFQSIFGSDADLRREAYHEAAHGRELYRNVIVTLTAAWFRGSMSRYLARRAGRLLITRSAGALTALTITVAALSGLIQPAGAAIFAALKANDFFVAAETAVTALFIVLGGTLLSTMLVERLLDRIILRVTAPRED